MGHLEKVKFMVAYLFPLICMNELQEQACNVFGFESCR